MTTAPAKPQHRAPAGRSPAGRCALGALAAGVLFALTACVASPAPAPDAPSDSTSPVPAQATTSAASAPEPGQPADAAPAAGSAAPSPVPSPSADASGIAAAVESALRAVAGSRDSVSREEVRTAIEQGFADAGSAPETVEVSIDRTPTGLDVDAIQGAGRTEGTCIFGEVREGAVSVAVLPALASGLCFVGDQR